ncbi:unnamed protein product [Caenorhabditis angaria]|uniref:Uncharacterized protein n=1 Tax=Caenorhabditis angaria TaxID=860376 RepID=A0A9P1I4H1_9PELO|nr:unnamed protein product [Caenorhabditis angaria]
MNIFSFLVLIPAALAVDSVLLAKYGEKTTIQISNEKVKAFTRDTGSDLETYNIEGPNKNKWIDKKGNTIGDPKNYEFKPPGTLIIKKIFNTRWRAL